jgi:hypothetical protein
MAVFPMGVPAGANVLATCGPSTGQAYYFDSKPGWYPDKISIGEFIFTMDDKNHPNLIFRDARGKMIDAASDGAQLTFTRVAAPEFSILLLYPQTGVTESYNLIVSGKKRKLLWTSSKVHAGGIITKVGAYTADCD